MNEIINKIKNLTLNDINQSLNDITQSLKSLSINSDQDIDNFISKMKKLNIDNNTIDLITKAIIIMISKPKCIPIKENNIITKYIY